MATSRTASISIVSFCHGSLCQDSPMMGMTVQAVRVLLATAMIESSSSSLLTSPASLSFSSCGQKYFLIGARNICRKLPQHWRASPWPAVVRLSSPPPPAGSSPLQWDRPKEGRHDGSCCGLKCVDSPWRQQRMQVRALFSSTSLPV